MVAACDPTLHCDRGLPRRCRLLLLGAGDDPDNVRGGHTAVHREVPEGHLPVGGWDEPLGVSRVRLRGADDRRVPTVPPGRVAS